jgi:hypothetical protein
MTQIMECLMQEYGAVGWNLSYCSECWRDSLLDVGIDGVAIEGGIDL